MTKNKKAQPEYQLQVAISNYISIQYPKVLFLSDTVASLKLTIPQSLRNSKIQKKGFKTPDILILQPNVNYHGLFIELKVDTPFKKNGDLKKSEHLEAQQKSINDLNRLGYYATFSWGFEKTKSIIDDYLNNQSIITCKDAKHYCRLKNNGALNHACKNQCNECLKSTADELLKQNFIIK